jgi:hypothetical protein
MQTTGCLKAIASDIACQWINHKMYVCKTEQQNKESSQNQRVHCCSTSVDPDRDAPVYSTVRSCVVGKSGSKRSWTHNHLINGKVVSLLCDAIELRTTATIPLVKRREQWL